MDKFERLDRELVHKGHIISLYKDTLRTPEGKIVEFDYIGHQGAAAVVPVTADGKLLMVRQYRNALDRETLEIPAGGLDGPDEPTMKAAARELKEETGFFSDDLELLLTIRTTVAFCNEKIDIYVARNLVPGTQDLDEDEFIESEAYTIDELCEKIYAGEIQDSKTVAAILAYKNKYVH